MSTLNCGCRSGCTGTAVIASVIIGVLTAIFQYTALITITPAFLWVLFGIAVGFLGIALLLSSACCADKRNCRQSLTQFLAGLTGTILTALILLGITFAATSVVGAIIAGLLLFFFSLAVTSTVCLIKCNYINS